MSSVPQLPTKTSPGKLEDNIREMVMANAKLVGKRRKACQEQYSLEVKVERTAQQMQSRQRQVAGRWQASSRIREDNNRRAGAFVRDLRQVCSEQHMLKSKAT